MPPVVTWSSAAVRSQVADELDLERVRAGTLPQRIGTLVACGCGTFIDLAKAGAKTGSERVPRDRADPVGCRRRGLAGDRPQRRLRQGDHGR